VRFGSVCSGIEAASAAWHPLGWEAAWFSEIEPFPCAVLAHHYPEVPNHGDMTKLPQLIRSGEVEAPDLFCGGTPCQAFSVAGLRRSLDDARGNLSLTFCEIADAIDAVRRAGGKPASIVFWENVPGVLSTADNAFGCFLSALAGCDTAIDPLAATGWTNAGVVAGPQRTVAWRVLDAQFFGLAQRRRRVFVVASAREGFDPVEVLLEFDGVRRDSAPSREAGEGAAVCPTLRAGGNSTGGDRPPGTDVDTADSLQVVQPYTVGNTLTARMHKGINTTLDEGQTPVLAHSLRGEGFDASEDGTGRGTPLVPVHVPDVAGTMKACKDSGGWSNSADHAAAGYMVPVHAFDARQSDQGPMLVPVSFKEKMSMPSWGIDQAQTLQALNFEAVALAALPFDTTQITSKANVSNPKPGDPCHPLAAGAHAPAVAFDILGTPATNGAKETDLHVALRARPPGASEASTTTVAMSNMQVRRLTPVECERLQGFPDGYTAIPWRNKSADQCPDGPRYKALGNSWAVPVVRWIGERINAVTTARKSARQILCNTYSSTGSDPGAR